MPKGFTDKPVKMRTCPHCGLHGRVGSIGTHIRYTHQEDKEAQFWARIDKNGPNGCWIWAVGARDKWGYGDLRWQGKHVQPHRLVWRLLKGEPGALDVLHKCNNPPCCNPDHLYLGTDKDNARDRLAANTYIRGEAMHNAKLTEDDVRAIRKKREEEGTSYYKLAAAYGMNYASIRYICLRETWTHVK